MKSAESFRAWRRSLAHTRDERGQMVLLIALASFALVGIASLVIDVSFMYEKRNRLQAAADAAAKSAALEARRGNTGNLLAFARREAVAHGFSNSVVQSVNCPPTSGAYTGGVCGTTSSYVEVILQETTSTFFARVLSFANMAPGARAVAGGTNSSNCLVALTGTGTAISIDGGSAISALNCGVAANSTAATALSVSGGSNLTAGSIGVTGGASIVGGSSASPTPQTGVPPRSDPLSGLPAPAITSPCTTNQSPGQPYWVTWSNGTLNPGTYCGFLVDGGGTATFNPGTYVFQGPITLTNGGRVNATGGVTIYLQTGILVLNGGTTLNLTAPSTGTYAGIAFWQPASNVQTINVTNGATVNVNGIWYGPTAPFRLAGGVSFSGSCSVVVAWSITLSNGGGFGNDCSVFGGNPLRKIALAE